MSEAEANNFDKLQKHIDRSFKREIACNRISTNVIMFCCLFISILYFITPLSDNLKHLIIITILLVAACTMAYRVYMLRREVMYVRYLLASKDKEEFKLEFNYFLKNENTFL